MNSYRTLDPTLPLLPGQIGPATTTLRIQASAAPASETVTLPRIQFDAVVQDDEEEFAIEDLKTMILTRPEDPYAEWSKVQLYRRAKELGVPGRSTYTKAQLRQKLIEFEGR